MVGQKSYKNSNAKCFFINRKCFLSTKGVAAVSYNIDVKRLFSLEISLVVKTLKGTYAF